MELSESCTEFLARLGKSFFKNLPRAGQECRKGASTRSLQQDFCLSFKRGHKRILFHIDYVGQVMCKSALEVSQAPSKRKLEQRLALTARKLKVVQFQTDMRCRACPA